MRVATDAQHQLTRWLRVTVLAVVASILLGVGWIWHAAQVVGDQAAQGSLQLLELEEALGQVRLEALLLGDVWKDTLIEHPNALGLARRKAQFEVQSGRVRMQLERVQGLLQGAGLATELNPAIGRLMDAHVALSLHYLDAFLGLDVNHPVTWLQQNDRVAEASHTFRGMLEQQYALLDARLASVAAQAGRWSAQRHGAWGWVLGALAVLMPLVALLGLRASHRAMRDLGRADRQVRAAVNALGEAVILTDTQQRVSYANPAAMQLVGDPLAHPQGMPFEFAFPLTARSAVWADSPDAPGADPYKPTSHTLRRRDGGVCAVAQSRIAVLDTDGQDLGTAIVLRDMTPIDVALTALTHERTLYEETFAHASVGMAHLSVQGRWTRVNQRLCIITGYTQAELLERSFQGITHPEDLRIDLQQGADLLAGRRTDYQTEKRYIRADGRVIWVALSVSVVCDPRGKPEYGISIIQDITEQVLAKTRIERLAYHDHLTGLANRRLLMDRLQQGLASAQRRDWLLGLLFIDLDYFKFINDSLGHPVGDQVLLQVAERLNRLVRQGDTVARVGGDEFVLLLSDVRDAEDAGRMAERCIAELSRPIVVGPEELHIAASIGVALGPTDGSDAQTVLKNADAALYEAKQRGRATFRYFTQALNDQATERLRIEGLLHQALANDEFVLYYQPQIELSTRRVTGCEALIRWNQPTLGQVAPARFIPVAEHSNLINEIGRWVMHEACAQAKRWQDQGLDLKVSFNVSARQFLRKDELIADLRSALACGVNAGRMCVELTESMLLDATHMSDVLHDITALGFELALDDFGTGYSSLAYLRKFPIHRVKIDRSFVGQSDVKAEDAEMVRTIVGMARNLRMGLVAEGVETLAQCDLLNSHRCDVAQGYYFGHPMPVDQFAAWVATNGGVS